MVRHTFAPYLPEESLEQIRKEITRHEARLFSPPFATTFEEGSGVISGKLPKKEVSVKK